MSCAAPLLPTLPLTGLSTAPSGPRSPGTAAWRAEALVFSTNFRLGFEPALFQPVLPKNYIHRMLPGEPVYSLMEAWKRAARRTQPERAWGLRRWFVAAAHALAGEGYAVQLHGRWPELGFLIVRLTTPMTFQYCKECAIKEVHSDLSSHLTERRAQCLPILLI